MLTCVVRDTLIRDIVLTFCSQLMNLVQSLPLARDEQCNNNFFSIPYYQKAGWWTSGE